MTRTPTIEPPVAPGGPDDGAPDGSRPVERRRGFRLSLWGGLVALVLAGVALLAVLPTRAWMHQRDQVRAGEAQLAELDARNAALRAQLEHLQSPEAVDEVARDKLGLVKPTEKALAVNPAPELTLAALPARWPYTLLQQLAAARD
jgi:cell division protein FtsB